MLKRNYLLIFITLLITAQLFATRLPNFWDDAPPQTLATQITDAMTDKELYAQTLMFGWAGSEPGHLLFDWVDLGLGSVKVFGWNTDNLTTVAKTITKLQRAAQKNRFHIPLFVATDQEGGWVRHVKGETSVTPGNMAIGSTALQSDAWYSAYYINREIKALGINMNFAPTVDLFTNKDSTIIGTRSFSSDPNIAATLSLSYTNGIKAAGVIPTAKHFPGHGATSSDSHVNFPIINATRDTFESRELAPFKALVSNGVDCIMSGHLAFPKVDPTRPLPPASLSHYMLTDILQKELGFNGLIITDDMMMNGVTSFAVLSKAYYLALMAGNDIMISSRCATLDEPLWVNNLKAMKSDKTFRSRVKNAAYKVILAKLRYFKSNNTAPLYPDYKTIKDHIPDKDGEKFFLEQACRSIVLYKKGTIPLTPKTAGKTLLVGNVDEFFKEGKRYFPNAAEFRYSYELGPIESLWMSEHIGATAKSYKTIIICVSSVRTKAIADALKPLNKRVIVLSLLTPQYSMALSPWADSIIVGYGTSSYSMQALFGVLNGDFSPKGVLP